MRHQLDQYADELAHFGPSAPAARGGGRPGRGRGEGGGWQGVRRWWRRRRRYGRRRRPSPRRRRPGRQRRRVGAGQQRRRRPRPRPRGGPWAVLAAWAAWAGGRTAGPAGARAPHSAAGCPRSGGGRRPGGWPPPPQRPQWRRRWQRRPPRLPRLRGRRAGRRGERRRERRRRTESGRRRARRSRAARPSPRAGPRPCPAGAGRRRRHPPLPQGGRACGTGPASPGRVGREVALRKWDGEGGRRGRRGRGCADVHAPARARLRRAQGGPGVGRQGGGGRGHAVLAQADQAGNRVAGGHWRGARSGEEGKECSDGRAAPVAHSQRRPHVFTPRLLWLPSPPRRRQQALRPPPLPPSRNHALASPPPGRRRRRQARPLGAAPAKGGQGGEDLDARGRHTRRQPGFQLGARPPREAARHHVHALEAQAPQLAGDGLGAAPPAIAVQQEEPLSFCPGA